MSDGMKKLARGAGDKIDAEKLKSQAADVAAAVTVGAHHAADAAGVLAVQARDAAVQAKDWGAPKVDAVVEWATPRIEQAWNDTLKAAAPRVERAAEKAAPVIDSAHERFVDDIVPKVVAAINAAAEKSASATVRGVEVAGEKTSSGATYLANSLAAASQKGPLKLAEAAKLAEKQSKRSGKAWWIVGGVAAAGGAYVLWKRSQPTTDPWAEPWEKVDASGFDEVVDDAKGAVGDAAEAVGEVAGVAVAKSREVSGKVAESVEDISEKVSDKISGAKATAKKATSRPRAKKAGESASIGVDPDITSGDSESAELASDDVATPLVDAPADILEASETPKHKADASVAPDAVVVVESDIVGEDVPGDGTDSK